MYIYYPSCNFQKQFPKTSKAIRAYILKQPDIKIAGCCHKTSDMPENRDEESFDGPFLLHEPNEENRITAPHYFADYLPQHITPLPEKEWKIYFNKQAEKYTTKKAVCYCNTCVKGAREGGADAAHLCELVFGE